MKIEFTYSEISLLHKLLDRKKSELEELIVYLKSDERIGGLNNLPFILLFESEIESINVLHEKIKGNDC